MGTHCAEGEGRLRFRGNDAAPGDSWRRGLRPVRSTLTRRVRGLWIPAYAGNDGMLCKGLYQESEIRDSRLREMTVMGTRCAEGEGRFPLSRE